MGKLKIAILFGGCSEEHDVSVKSAQEIAKSIDTEKYEPVYIGITRCGTWLNCKMPNAKWEDEKCLPAVISPDRKTHGLIFLKNGELKSLYIDVVFPVLHGKSGEDGTIQGLLELSGIPYVGCDVGSSVVCMDKSLAHMIVRSEGIATPDFGVYNCGDICDVNDYPVFVKPLRSGSSFGVTKVRCADELTVAIKLAGQYDRKIIIEQAINGSEVGCAILGNGFELLVGEVDQITLTHGFFRIHQERKPEIGSENADITVPANLPSAKREQIVDAAKTIYKALGCKGLARVDMFLQEDGSIVFNEVNTLPGFTAYSRYPRMMDVAGISLTEIIDRLIMLALER